MRNNHPARLFILFLRRYHFIITVLFPLIPIVILLFLGLFVTLFQKTMKIQEGPPEPNLSISATDFGEAHSCFSHDSEVE